MKKYISLILLFISVALHAQSPQPLSADQAFAFSATAKDYQTILVQWKMAPGNYLYEKKFAFTVLKPKNVMLGEPLYPSGAHPLKTALGTFSVYSNAVIIPIPVINATEKSVVLHVHYQGCSHEGYCYPPATKIVAINLNGNYMQWVNGTTVNTVSHNELAPLTLHAQAHDSRMSPALTIISFFGFGILLSLTPCVLPMIPILSSIILGRKEITVLHAFCLSLFYVLGMAVTYAFIGVLFALLGKNIQMLFQESWIMILFAVFFVVMALSLFGLFQLQLPEKWRHVLAEKSYHQKSGTYFGVTMMGVLSTLILSPCVTPPLVAALGIISQAGNMLLGGLALFVMGFGMGAPLLLIGALGPKILPKPGRWMNIIKYGMGIVLLGMAVMMAQRAEPQLFESLFHSSEAPQTTLRFQAVKTVADINTVLADPNNKNKVVMLDFYATWCLACKELDTLTFQDKAIQQALSKIVLLRADITKNTLEDQLLEQHYGVIAPPTLLFFRNGQEIPNGRIIGYQGPKPFLKHIDQLTVSSGNVSTSTSN